ncbi:MAG: hypothetical protein ACXADL_02265 [Candidatus Thorarchaeota archaeon]|jgi:hypothetical protein
MPEYDLGILTVFDHDVKKLTDALGIAENRFDELVDSARKAWEFEDTISESIEWLAQRLNGSELILALVFFGRIWEQNTEQEGEEEEEE